MMRIASAAPAADLLTGPAPADDPAAASAFAAELDAATPTADAPTAPAPGAAVDAESPATAMTLDPATAATILANPIVHPLPAVAAVEGEEGEAHTAADTAGHPGAVDAAMPAPSTDQPSQTGDLPGDTPLDAPTEHVESPVRDSATTPVVPSTPATPAVTAAADDAPAAPAADAQAEDADPAPTPVAAPQATSSTATPAAPVAASTAIDDRPAAEPRVPAQPATASVSSVDAAAPPAAAPTTPVESAPAVKDAAPTATNVTPIAAPAATTAPAPVAAPPATASAGPVNAAPLLDQVRVPIAALRELPDGAHLVTVHVTPDELGPVTVRALVHGGALDVQLTAPTDAAREALKALLPDLRRDLSQGGQPALLSLGDATTDGAPARERDAARDALPGRRGDVGPETAAPRPAAPVRAGLATLDVLA